MQLGRGISIVESHPFWRKALYLLDKHSIVDGVDEYGCLHAVRVIAKVESVVYFRWIGILTGIRT
jgi:hypothetical protein